MSAQIVLCDQFEELTGTIVETLGGKAQAYNIRSHLFDGAHFGVDLPTDFLRPDNNEIVGRNTDTGQKIAGRLLAGR